MIDLLFRDIFLLKTWERMRRWFQEIKPWSPRCCYPGSKHRVTIPKVKNCGELSSLKKNKKEAAWKRRCIGVFLVYACGSRKAWIFLGKLPTHTHTHKIRKSRWIIDSILILPGAYQDAHWLFCWRAPWWRFFFSTVFVVVGLVGSSHIRATKAMGKVWLMAPENERICPPWKWKTMSSNQTIQMILLILRGSTFSWFLW